MKDCWAPKFAAGVGHYCEGRGCPWLEPNDERLVRDYKWPAEPLFTCPAVGKTGKEVATLKRFGLLRPIKK